MKTTVLFLTATRLAAQSPCLAPQLMPAPAGYRHPSTDVQDSVPLDGTPFAVAVSRAGATYVTQSHTAAVARTDLPRTAFALALPVGDLPAQVRISPRGRTAYVGNQDPRTISFID